METREEREMAEEKDPTMQRHDRAFMPTVVIPEDFDEFDEEDEPAAEAEAAPDPTMQRHDRAFMPKVVIPDDLDEWD